MSSTSNDNTQSIESLYSEAYALVEQGICYDEVGQRDGALAMYERGLQLIDQAGQRSGAERSELFQKMRRARDHILFRLKDLRSDTDPSVAVPPPYDAISGAVDALAQSKDAEELFYIPAGVQIFFIQNEETSVPSYPTELRVFKFKDASSDGAAIGDGVPPAFLQIGDWVYPLMSVGRSPALHSAYGAYVFPNPTAESPNLCVGVLLPQDIDENTKNNFETLLKSLTDFKHQSADTISLALSEEEQERLSAKIAKFLIQSGQAIAWGINWGAEKGSKIAHKESVKYMDRSSQGDVLPIDPRVQTGVHYLRKGTKVAVKISGYLVDKVGLVGVALGRRLATSVEKRVGGGTGGSLVHDTIEVVGGGIAGAATVWMGLEAASKTLAKNIANDTVKVVDHKYGGEAANVVNNALYATGHGGMAAWNINELGFKAIAKRTAKQAGLQVLKDLGEEGKVSKSGAKEEAITAPTTEDATAYPKQIKKM